MFKQKRDKRRWSHSYRYFPDTESCISLVPHTLNAVLRLMHIFVVPLLNASAVASGDTFRSHFTVARYSTMLVPYIFTHVCCVHLSVRLQEEIFWEAYDFLWTGLENVLPILKQSTLEAETSQPRNRSDIFVLIKVLSAEKCCLGCNAAYSGINLSTFRRNLLPPSSELKSKLSKRINKCGVQFASSI
jgi:hypothetical protein